MTMLGRLYYYFGVTGILSVLLWAASLVLLARFGWRPERTRRYLAALGLAVLALLLAGINSGNINAIRPDMTAEINAARERGERLAREQDAAAREETDKGAETTTNIYEAAASGNEFPAESSYRTRGKIDRDQGKKEEDRVLTKNVAPVEEEATGRLMKQEDMYRALRWDRLNLFMARSTLWLAVLLVMTDYVRRFNRTFGFYFPLPLSCRSMDAMSPKKYAVHVREASAGALRKYLRDAVRKNESFVYFGDAESLGLVPESCGIPRIILRDPRPVLAPWLARGWHAARLDSRPAVIKFSGWMRNRRDVGLTPMEVIPCRAVAPGSPQAVRAGTEQAAWPVRATFLSDFVFESAWFGRYGFVVVDHDLSAAWLGEWMDFLRMRQHVLASTRRTVNVFWNTGQVITPDALREIIFLCRETNCRFILIGNDDAYNGLADEFDEVWPEMPGSESGAVAGPVGPNASAAQGRV